MGLTVSSFFKSKVQGTRVNSIIKRFTFNGSDVSARVIDYAEFTHDTTQFVPGDYVVEVENAGQIFNSLYLDKTQFYKIGTIEYGFSIEGGGGYDTVQLFGGELTKANFRNGRVQMHFQDKLTRLTEKKIGDDKNPISYTSSNYYPSDLAWYLVTSYGGLSTVKSDSNIDIDYATWAAWHNGFVADSVVVQGRFDGQNVAEALQKIARLTDSTIFDEGDNKIDFARWAGVTSFFHTITDSHTTETAQLELTGNELINTVDVLIGYNPSSNSWAGTITRVNTPSVNSYGVHKEVYDDTNVWFVNSVAAINQADRITFRRKEPNLRARLKTPLCFLDAVVGDMVYYTSRVHSFDNKLMTLTAYSVNIDDHTMVLDIDEGFGKAGGKIQTFILDDAYWGLLDNSHNPLY